ncbi:hypothetical protein BsWGS_08238 [Bradybaena similaris]
MEKSAGVPSAPYEGYPQSAPFEAIGAPPAYTDTPYPQGSNIPPGQGYAYTQGYPPAGQGYPMTGQGYPPAGQGYPPAGQGYPQSYGYPQQHFQQANVVLAQPLIQPQAIAGPPPPDRMRAAIFATLCCFWPTGIVAIMRASDARSALARGDIASAQAHARSAKSMIIISVVVGGIAYIVLGIIIGVYVGIIMSSRFADFD